MTVIAVEPDELRLAASEIYAAGDVVVGSFGPHAGDLIPNTQGGWQAVAQLQSAGQTWDTYIRAFGGRIDETAAAVMALADFMAAAGDEAQRPWGGRTIE